MASSHKKKSPSKTMKSLSAILLLGMLAAFCYLIYEAYALQIFTTIQIGIAAAFLLFLIVVFCTVLFRKRTHTAWRVIVLLACAALAVISTVGGYYIQETGAFFRAIGSDTPVASNGSEAGTSDDSDAQDAIVKEAASLSEKMAVTVTTYSRTTAECYTPADLSGKKVGIVPDLDKEGTKEAIKQLESRGMKDAELIEYSNQYELVDNMWADEVDAIIFPEQYHADLQEAANDENKYNGLTTFSNTIDQYIYYEEIPEEMKNKADPVKNIDEDPFVVMISGSDSYGTLSPKARTDVNMLAAVNPKTHQVLLVSLPRDSYMQFSCDKNELACGYAAGQYDKLTHSGIYGIGTTESSIEDFLDIEINYTVQVNFSSLINVVDAIDGIDVEVEPGLEVETFYSNGTEGVHAGINHLDGERALAFARERHAYVDGDNQRIKNQQIVMKALLKSMLSPSMLLNYPDFLRALSTAFTTNMPSSQIRDLIRLEVSSFPSWNIQSYALTGDSSTEYCAALGAAAFVTLVYDGDIETAHDLIETVLRGGTPAVPEQSSEGTVTKPDGTTSQEGDEAPIAIPEDPYYYDPSVQDPGTYNDEPAVPADPIPSENPNPVEPAEPDQTPVTDLPEIPLE